MTDPWAPPSVATLTMQPTTDEAVELTRRMVQKRALESAELILAELGIEEEQD